MLFLLQFDSCQRPYRREIQPTGYLAPRLYYVDEDGLSGEVDISPSVYLWDGSYAVLGRVSRRYWREVDCGYGAERCNTRYMGALRRSGRFVDEDGLKELIQQEDRR